MKKILQCLCVILILTNMIVYSDETDITSISDLIEYDVIYELETAETTTTLNATFTLTNNENVAKNPLLLVAAYYNGRMIDMQTAQKNITEVVFDRGGYIYQGKVQALADAAREAGLEF